MQGSPFSRYALLQWNMYTRGSTFKKCLDDLQNTCHQHLLQRFESFRILCIEKCLVGNAVTKVVLILQTYEGQQGSNGLYMIATADIAPLYLKPPVYIKQAPQATTHNITLYRTVLHCDGLRSLYYTVLHFITLYCTELPSYTVLHCITLWV